MARNTPLQKREFALEGKLIKSDDPAVLVDNFQDLINLRYTDKYPKGIGGMTKINTTALTNPKVRAAYHYTKEQPAESHLVVQAFDASDANPKVYQNTTAVPSAGDFSATVLHTDDTAAGDGRFADAPGGALAYCNGKESLIWGGDEYRCSGFVVYDPNNTYKYDYSSVVQNTKTDAQNVATIANTAGGIDANTMLLLHCDGADSGTTFTDSSPTTPHTVTAVANAQTKTATKKFGTASGYFDGTGDWLTIPDDADFDLSGGTWTIDCWVYITDISADRGIYSQARNGVASDYMWIYVTSTGVVTLTIQDTSAPVVSVTTPASTIGTGTWYHLEVVENGDDYYIFVDGQIKGYSSDTNRTEAALAYDTTVFIGATHDGTATTKPFFGYIDELRVSNSARDTSNFVVPEAAYATGSPGAYAYLGSTRPLDGFKITMGSSVNASAGTLAVKYWSGSAWTAVSTLVDNTESPAGTPMAITGTVTFDSTTAVSKLKAIDGVVLYWYQLYWDTIDASTTVSHITVSQPMQDVVDIGDGVDRACASFVREVSGVFQDYTNNVSEEDYTLAANTFTYANVPQTTAQYIYAGFLEPMMGFSVLFPISQTNTSVATITVEYWNGTAWTSVGVTDDQTAENGKSWNKSGTVTWTPPTPNSEFKRTVNRGQPLYYYKIYFSANLSSVYVDLFTGISAPTKISSYKFPIFAHDRLWLCGDQNGKKNSARCSSLYTDAVYNGEDTKEFEFGDDTTLTAGAELYSPFGSSVYRMAIFAKAHETWVLIGSSPEDWVIYPVSQSVGCVAHRSMKVANALSGGVVTSNQQVVIFQGANGIYKFDGRSLTPIHMDVKHLFDKKDSASINTDKISESVGFVDEEYGEYHLMVATGTSTVLNEEWVYDLGRNKWYQIDRTADLVYGLGVTDTNGNRYTYGVTADGYVERLENGTDFDGNDIVHTMHTGDIALGDGSIFQKQNVRYVKLVTVAKSTTSNSVSLTHYGDTSTTGDTAITKTVAASGKRLAQIVESVNWRTQVFSSIKAAMTTDDETIGFQPIFLGLYYEDVREDRT